MTDRGPERFWEPRQPLRRPWFGGQSFWGTLVDHDRERRLYEAERAAAAGRIHQQARRKSWWGRVRSWFE